MTNTGTGLPNSWTSGSLWDLTRRAQVTTFIGAGGKTTCLQQMTKEIESAGLRVIATTTTKVFPEKQMKGWKNPNPPPYGLDGAYFWYVDELEESGKWMGPAVQAVDAAIASAGANASLRTVPNLHWVIEGDGARGLKLKCWELHEPQIPQRTDCAVLVLDAGLWGRVLLAEQVHRPTACRELLGHIWNAEQAWRYFLRSPVFAPQYGHMSWVILLNSVGETLGNGDLVDRTSSMAPLQDLCQRWTEILRAGRDLEYRPNHLRIAAGDAKEGKLEWFDLW